MTTEVDILALSAYRPEKLLEPVDNADSSLGIPIPENEGTFKKYLNATYSAITALHCDDYDVIIANSCGIVSFVSLVLSMMYGKKFVIRVTGDFWKEFDEKTKEYWDEDMYFNYLRFKLRVILSLISFRYVDGIITVSQELVSVAENNTQLERDSIAVVRSPVDIEKYSNGEGASKRRELGISETDVVISIVTHVHYYEKYLGALDAAKSISSVIDQRSNTHLVIAGYGEYYEDFESEFLEYDRVHFPGFVSDVEDLYDATDILVYFSYNDGYPNVILEAQCAGIPIVANADHGMKEQINHLETGILADSANDIKHYVEAILNEEIDAEMLGRNAFNQVSKRNNAESISRELQSKLVKILSE